MRGHDDAECVGAAAVDADLARLLTAAVKRLPRVAGWHAGSEVLGVLDGVGCGARAETGRGPGMREHRQRRGRPL